MRAIIILFALLFGCNKPKTVLICGDRECINKTEANIYFEENLSLEIKVLKDGDKKNYDLVKLNLQKNPDERKIFATKKNNTNIELKKISKKEKKDKLLEIKEKKRLAKLRDQKDKDLLKENIRLTKLREKKNVEMLKENKKKKITFINKEKIKKNKKKIVKEKVVKKVMNKKTLSDVDKIVKKENIEIKDDDILMIKNSLDNELCALLDKCDIDSISKFLTEKGKNKNFPDINSVNYK